MPINYNKLDEGDKLDAASLNDRFTSVGGAGQGVNNLGQADLDKRALRQEHLPNVITAADFPNGLAARGPTTVFGLTEGHYKVYDNCLNEGVLPATYQNFSTAGGNGVPPCAAPYGPSNSVAFPLDGWRIPAINSTATRPVGAPFYEDPAEVLFPAITNGPSLTPTNPYKGFLVRFSIGLYGAEASPSGNTIQDGVVIGIGWVSHTGDRHVIEKSVRWFNNLAKFKGSLDTFTFITRDDIVQAGVPQDDVGIAGVFGVVACGEANSASGGFPASYLDFYNLDMLPIRAGDLV